MSLAETWEPGDPLMPDNGCGPMPSTHMTPDERTAAMAEDATPPPWWRPQPEAATRQANRRCAPCDVAWAGALLCWVCGQEATA